ncbi:MAG: hypothetical protein Q8L97_01470, partial [Nitrosomonas sp.]
MQGTAQIDSDLDLAV